MFNQSNFKHFEKFNFRPWMAYEFFSESGNCTCNKIQLNGKIIDENKNINTSIKNLGQNWQNFYKKYLIDYNAYYNPIFWK